MLKYQPCSENETTVWVCKLRISDICSFDQWRRHDQPPPRNIKKVWMGLLGVILARNKKKTFSRGGVPSWHIIKNLHISKNEVGDSILAKSRFSPSVDHCSKPRGYPRKIFVMFLTNMYTITKKNIIHFWDESRTSKIIDFRHPWFALI